jgi:tetratricopeptide (TPR) repeat protein
MKLAEYRHWARQQAASRRDALDAEPGCLGVRLDLAWHLYGLGLMYDALATLAPVLYDDDPPAAVRHCAGVALRTLGRHAEALAQLVAAVEQEPSEAAYRLDLARVLRARRSGLAAAAEQLEAAAEIAPGAAEVWIELAELRTHSHDTTGAQAAWLKAVGLQPELRHAPLYRGLIEQVLGRD